MPEGKIPEKIKRYRPEKCSEVKFINGHYYVYRYKAVLLTSGKWGKKSGPCIGSIIPDVGFKPNKNFLESDIADSITVIDYGQYAFIEEAASSVRQDLEQCFTLDKAAQIFTYAVILYANGFVHIDQIQRIYEQTWLQVEYKDYTFKMGHNALDTLLDDLGRKTTGVRNYEQQCIYSSLKEIAIDGHAIRSCSEENDPGEAGYKFKKLGEDQVNLLMGYDINTGKPLFARMYRGSCNDKATMPDLAEYLEYSGIEFVVDRGFYSRKNLKLLSVNGNFRRVWEGDSLLTELFRDRFYAIIIGQKEVVIMTAAVTQRIVNRLQLLPDNAEPVIMNFIATIEPATQQVDVSKRIGIAEGEFEVPDDFDAGSDEIYKMLTETAL